MKRVIVLLSLIFACTDAWAVYSQSRDIRRATITSAKIVSQYSQGRDLHADINMQMLHLYGQLKKEYGAYPTLFDLNISNERAVARIDGLFDVTYDMSLFVSFTKGQAISSTPVWYPVDSTEATRTKIHQSYAGRCGVGRYSFSAEAYYAEFHPLAKNCFLQNQATHNYLNKGLLSFKVSGQQTSGFKKPAYNRVWEDNTLEATIYIGRFSNDSVLHHDGGIRAFNVTYRELLKIYGQPQSINSYGYLVSTKRWMGTDTTEPLFIDLVYGLGGGKKIKINLSLINSHEWNEARPEVISHYQKSSKTSDFIIYTGHGSQSVALGLAANNTAPGNKYQLMYLSSCESFSNMPYRYMFQNKIMNGGNKKDIDLLVNDNMFNYSKHAPLALLIVDELIEAKNNYQQILKKIENIKSPQEYYLDFDGPVGGTPPWAILLGEEE